jgi:hypothetical protein
MNTLWDERVDAVRQLQGAIFDIRLRVRREADSAERLGNVGLGKAHRALSRCLTDAWNALEMAIVEEDYDNLESTIEAVNGTLRRLSEGLKKVADAPDPVDPDLPPNVVRF